MEPEDKNGIVYYIFLLWGIGVLLPWNSVLSTFDFFDYEMDGYTLIPSFVYPFAVNGLATVTQVVVLIHGHKVSEQVKVQVCFVIEAIIMLILPLLAHIITSTSGSFWACFFLLLIFGAVNGMC